MKYGIRFNTLQRRIAGNTCAIVALAALLCSFAFNADAKRDRFEQEYFVIALWGDPPVDDAVNARYKTIEAAGFNVVLGGVGASTPDLARLQRDAAAATSLKVIFSTYGLPVGMLCNCDATYGFLTKDHPTLDDLDKVRARVREIRLERPGKLPLVNLFAPSTAPAELRAASYVEYMGKILEELSPEVICYDYFVGFEPDSDSRGVFVENLNTMRSTAKAHGLPFWNFIKAMPYDSDLAPTEAQIKWQVWTSVAYGARGLIYFAYWPPPDDPHARGEGILDTHGNPTPRYDAVKQLNGSIRPIAGALMALDSDGVRSGVELQSGALPEVLVQITDPDAAGFSAGMFSDARGGRAVLLVNDQLEAERVVTLALDTGVREIDPATGSRMEIEDIDASLPGIQARFAPGDARLYVKDAQ
jgi:hypothetical protein